MEQGDFGMIVSPKTVGHSRGHSRLVVEALDCAHREGVATACAYPVDQLGAVLAERAGQDGKGLDAGAQGVGGPTVEEVTSPLQHPVFPEGMEVLLEQVGTHRSEVDAQEIAQA